MAEVLNTFDFRSGRPRNPLFDRVLDGRIHRLAADDLEGCTPEAMRSRLHAAAKSRGLKVRTAVGPDHVVVQALDPNELDAAA